MLIDEILSREGGAGGMEAKDVVPGLTEEARSVSLVDKWDYTRQLSGISKYLYTPSSSVGRLDFSF